MNFFVVRCRERRPFAARLRVENYDELTRLDLAGIALGEDLQGGVATDQPLFLVCTHGRRDKCCAKFGYAIYKNLRAGGETVSTRTSYRNAPGTERQFRVGAVVVVERSVSTGAASVTHAKTARTRLFWESEM